MQRGRRKETRLLDAEAQPRRTDGAPIKARVRALRRKRMPDSDEFAAAAPAELQGVSPSRMT